MTRDEIVEFARTLIGTKFKLRGRTRMGIDCVGLPILIADNFGQKIIDDQSYMLTQPDKIALNKHLDANSLPAPLAPIKHGQIAKFRQSFMPLHLGIVATDTGRVTIINASLKKKKVVEEPFYSGERGESWASLLMELREFRGVTG